MPKLLHEIKKFVSGTISTPSERDVPEDAASYSKNIDSVTKDGILKSIPNDATTIDGSPASGTITFKDQPNTDDILFLGTSRPSGAIAFTSDTSVSPRCAIGASAEDTIDNLIAVCEGIAALNDVATFTRDGIDFNITYKTSGVAGNTFNTSMVTTANIIFEQAFLTGGSLTSFDKMQFIKDEEKYHLIGYKKSTGQISLYEDFYGDKTHSILGHAPADTIEIVKNNKELHVGTGNSGFVAPQWIGLPQNKWFGGEEHTSIINVDTAIQSPDALAFVEKYSSDGTSIYGAKFNGSTLYKIVEGTGVLTAISDIGAFKNIKAVSQVVGDYIWVFDTGFEEYGTLFKVDIRTLTAVREFHLEAYAKLDDTWVSDLIVTDNKIWFAHNSNNHQYEKLLWNTDIPSINGEITLTDRTPCSGTDKDEIAAYPTADDYLDGWHMWHRQETVDDPTDGRYPTYTYWTSEQYNRFTPYAISLVKHPTGTYIGWFVAHRKSQTRGGAHADDDGDGFGDGGTLKKDWVYGIATSGREYTYDAINDEKCLYILSETHVADTHAYLFSLDTPMHHDKVKSIFYDGTKLVLCGSETIAWNTHNLAAGAVGNAVNMTSGWTVFDQPDNYDGRITSATTYSLTDYFILHTIDTNLKIVLVNKATNAFVTVLNDSMLRFTITPETGTAGSMPYDKKIYYKVSFTYDGYQESPLSSTTYTQTTGTAEGSSTTSIEPNHDIELKIMDRNAVSKRLSHVNVYAAESPTGDAAEEGYYRLLRRGDYKLSSPKWYLYTTTPVAEIDFENDNRLGQSYEARTGISEVLRESNLFYSLATTINNTLVVGGCHHEDIDGAENWLFKSLPYRYDIFNWSSDYLKLPDTPNDIIAFNGRVYCFTDNQTFRINTDSMIVEDIFDGAGCINNNSTIVTEFGLFFADKNHIYIHNGQSPVILSTPISKSEAGLYGWQEGTITYVSMSFDSTRNSVLVFHTRGSDGYCWAYNIGRKRWDLWDAPAYITGTLIGKDGEVYITDNTKMYEYLGGTGFRTWEWESKAITLNSDTQNKMFYKLRGIGSAHTLEYKVNDGSSWSGSWQSVTNEKISSTDKKSKSIKVKIIPTAATDTIDSLGLIYRRLPVQ